MGEIGAVLAARCDRIAVRVDGDATNVVRFPSDTNDNFRLLVRFISDLVGNEEGLRDRVEEIRLSASAMVIDDYACVFTGSHVRDLHFSLDMRDGCKILLITDSVSAMARFVAGYLIRRHEGDPELASYL